MMTHRECVRGRFTKIKMLVFIAVAMGCSCGGGSSNGKAGTLWDCTCTGQNARMNIAQTFHAPEMCSAVNPESTHVGDGGDWGCKCSNTGKSCVVKDTVKDAG